MSIKEGTEWTVFDTPFAMEEVSAPSIVEDNTLKLYAKDLAGVSALFYKGDDEVEKDLSGGLTGSGAANRLAYWTGATVLGAVGALTFHRLLVADTNGLPTNNAALTATRIPFADANGELDDDSALAWDDASKFLRLGSAAPLTGLHLSNATFANAVVRTDGLSGTQGGYIGFRITGSASVADALQVFFGGGGSHTGLAADATFTSLMGIKSAETWTATAKGSYITLETTPLLSTSRAERFRVGPSGQLGIGGATFGSANDVFKSGGASAAPSWVAPAAVTAASTKITLAGSPSVAGLAAFSIDVNQANLDHGSIGGLGDDDHTQYALLLGRSGGQTLIGGTASGDDLTLTASSHSDGGSLLLNSGTLISSATDFVAATIRPTFTGSGDGAQALNLQPIFQPSASVSTAYAFLNIAKGNPPTGVTITTLVGGFNRIDTGNGVGAITQGLALFIGDPSLGSLKPTTLYGIYIANQGASGVTNAIGLNIVAQSGATNNTGIACASIIDISGISAGSPNLKITATSDTPTVAWSALGTFPPTTAPAGYLEILVGANARYIPFWA